MSAARADSSTAKVPSWTSSCAAWAAIRVISQGAVSPVITTLRPARGLAHHLVGPDLRAVHRDRLAALQTPEVAVVG